jgi:hypothetical protein
VSHFELTKRDQNMKNNMSGRHTMRKILTSIITLRGISALTTAMLMVVPFAMAGEHSSNGHATTEHGASHKHIVGIFIGATTDAHNETDTTVGVEYEYMLLSMLGLGAVYEHTPDAHHEEGVSVYLASVYLHPYAGFRIGMGAGEEKVHGSHGHTESLMRGSIAYDFHVAGIGIAPTLNLDRVDDENVESYGIVLSKGF